MKFCIWICVLFAIANFYCYFFMAHYWLNLFVGILCTIAAIVSMINLNSKNE